MADGHLVILLARGADAWNRERPPGPLDLTHLAIRDADMRGIDLQRANPSRQPGSGRGAVQL